MDAWIVLAAALLSGNAANNGVPEPDSEYEKAVTSCTYMLIGQALKNGGIALDGTGHRAAFDAMEEKCRHALGALIEH